MLWTILLLKLESVNKLNIDFLKTGKPDARDAQHLCDEIEKKTDI